MIPTKHTYTKEGRSYINPFYVKYLVANELIVDASAGGLISGPSLAAGGITLIGWNVDAEVFIAGQTEGWVFLINDFARFDNQDTLMRMSCYTPLSDFLFQPYLIPSHINVLNVEQREVNGEIMTPVLFFDTNQTGTMPRVPAKANLSFLDTINRAAWLKHVVEKQPKGTIKETALLARFGPSGDN